MTFKERKNYNKVISIKLVIPSGCNANCCFCYMKDYKNIMRYDKELFLENFINSLDFLLNKIGNKNPVSLDITGNEPTLDVILLRKVLGNLRDYGIKNKVQRVTITTNGMNLKEVIANFIDVIDYVNISVHDFEKSRRQDIMQCNPLMDIDYQCCIKKLNEINIPVSAVAVIYKDIPNFSLWVNSFMDWCKDIGFIGLRLRCDVFWEDNYIFEKYIESVLQDTQFKILNHEKTTDSHWCRLRRYDKFRLFFLKGVLDTSVLTKGIEYVISDDGLCYCDFYKRIKIEDYKYEIGKIYDKRLIWY